jgi:hypothetical protein
VINKKQVRWTLKQIQRVKTWQLVILLILISFVVATFLRLNNIGMVERRAAVINADNAGDSQSTQSRLYDLQRYVSSHMNTSLGNGVYLEASYNRERNRLIAEATSSSDSNSNIYKKVQEVCMPQFSYWSYAYVMCTYNELSKYPASNNLVSSIKEPSIDLYRYNFISPLWSPDFAGWSVLICVVILIMIIVRLTSVIILKLILHQRYKSI